MRQRVAQNILLHKYMTLRTLISSHCRDAQLGSRDYQPTTYHALIHCGDINSDSVEDPEKVYVTAIQYAK